MPDVSWEAFRAWADKFPPWTRIYVPSALWFDMVDMYYAQLQYLPEIRDCDGLRYKTITILPKARWRKLNA